MKVAWELKTNNWYLTMSEMSSKRIRNKKDRVGIVFKG